MRRLRFAFPGLTGSAAFSDEHLGNEVEAEDGRGAQQRLVLDLLLDPDHGDALRPAADLPASSRPFLGLDFEILGRVLGRLMRTRAARTARLAGPDRASERPMARPSS